MLSKYFSSIAASEIFTISHNPHLLLFLITKEMNYVIISPVIFLTNEVPHPLIPFLLFFCCITFALSLAFFFCVSF